MTSAALDRVRQTLDEIREAGFYKHERTILTPQKAQIETAEAAGVLNLCANNYLGLANYSEVVDAARKGLDEWGFGLASVRFICGTQSIHRDLENAITKFLGTEDTILYSSCFDANGGLFETLLGPDDAVFSDELNHASIIDGIRLCKARRYRYKNNDAADLDRQLSEDETDGTRLIATDGVFSMDGIIADLPVLCAVAEKHSALLMMDDCHAAGFLGPQGRGTHEHHDVMGRIDIITGTLGKALGGASGGYTSGRKEIIELLRQRSRPYLFSNTLAPPIVTGSLKAIELLSESTVLQDRLRENTAFFRSAMTDAGFDIIPGTHPITPVMLGDAKVASEMSDRLLQKGVYVIGFSYPVVPKGKARIRCQVSAAHSQQELAFAVEQFKAVRAEMGLG